MCSGKKEFHPSEAEDLEKQNLNSKIKDLTDGIKVTKGDLHAVSDQLREHLRTTTTITSTTTASCSLQPLRQPQLHSDDCYSSQGCFGCQQKASSNKSMVDSLINYKVCFEIIFKCRFL